ncbi:unnamed protein product [Didymodactylos carnosus]|uniref:Uncharacterized protein n=1 Tax=Didymodactylos carnosus TaxID=1234261 RepID=A0A814KRS7_9BILA|nr:unnamed protein product [Didymodactylos carnosus]CAF1055204.1 unnamed protein product [Didymodactylos carnosus]CAF3784814.1 unnamed protein product [Didymodactylos carnosus]CAF3824337.1 unnamed protein product [Didymodactylos carnosus]
MVSRRILLFAGSGIASFALLLIIISVGTPNWLDDGSGYQVGLFKTCTSSLGCSTNNRVTQGGLSVFGLLLLFFGIVTAIAGAFVENMSRYLILASVGFLFFSSMFIMSAYATWGVYSRDSSYSAGTTLSSSCVPMSWSYNLAVASHFFLLIALTLIAMVFGEVFLQGRNDSS